MNRLTARQIEALSRVAGVEKASAYAMHVGLNTLRALKARGLVSSSGGLGSMAFPHTSIVWRITPAGRKALEAQ